MEGYSHLNDTARFQATSLIGNWVEEKELRRSILKDCLGKKSTGSLRLDAYHQRMATALSEVELTKVSDDPYVHCGDVVQLVHLESGCTLAGDVHDQDARPGEEACSATAAPEIRSPCSRNTFILLKYKPNKMAPLESYYDDDVLHYGQKIRLALNPAANGLPIDAEGGPRPLCLFSKPPSNSHYAKYSRKQLVGLTFRDTFDTVWQVLTPDPSQRVVSEGVEVLAGSPIILVHCATQKPLMVESQVYPNDFGNEWEVTARQSTSAGLKLAMEQTSTGILKGSLPKAENSPNYFTLITGTKVERLPVSESKDDAAEAVLSSFVSDVMSRPGAMSLLEKKLVTLSSANNELPVDDLLLLVRQVGSQITEADVQILVRHFLTHKRGVIDAGSLLQAIRVKGVSS